jgi:hypothetical protein
MYGANTDYYNSGLLCELPSELRAVFDEVLDARLTSALQQSLQPLEARITAPWTALAQGPEALLKYLQDHGVLSSVALETLLDTMQQKQIVCLPSRIPQAPQDTASLSSEFCSQHQIDEIPHHDEPLDAQDKGFCLTAQYLNKWNYKVEDIKMSRRVISRLNEWWLSESSLLWIQESTFGQTNRPSQVSAAVSTLAIEFRIPVAVYFCRSLGPISEYISHKQRLLVLVQGLSGTLRSYCPSSREPVSTKECIHHTQSPPTKDLSWNTIETNISDLQHQISCIHANLIIIIDGMNVIDYSGEMEVEDGLKKLLKILYHPRRYSFGVRLKTLLTTPGQTLFLLDRIVFEDRISAMDMDIGDCESLLAGLRREASLN